jgi:hypothetical protein
VDSLRRSSKGSFRLLIEPDIHCDYVLSERVAVVKMCKSETNRLYQCNDLIEKVEKAKKYFEEVMVLAVDDCESLYFSKFSATVSKSSNVMVCKCKS